ncbi:HNH endonuclease signature motif containing protein [Paraburkholderia caffeinilytica]|uniref:HNH endonuclease signature motif containing protein n=1 Tax=Paraburkholderia caffeinilytica TaxID=1761016 RepID=UPI0038B950D0
MITFDRAKELLEYNAETGILTRKVARSRFKAGDVAGYANDEGYIRICIDGRYYYGHQIAWLLYYGVWPARQIDHRSRVRHENWISNLREATNGQNSHYANKKISTSSGYRGVYFKKSESKWCAKIMSEGKTIHLGYFDDPAVAAEAYKAAAIKFHGEFANV